MGKILDRNKFKAERSGVFAQGVLTAAEMFFIEDSQEVRVERAAVTEHGEENAGEFMRGGGEGRRENRVWHEDGENSHPAQSRCDTRWSRPCVRH